MPKNEPSSSSSFSKRLKKKPNQADKPVESTEKPSGIHAINREHFDLIATCMLNFEDELANELRQLGASDIQKLNRAVRFQANLELLYKSNIWLRTALKILKPIFQFSAKNEDEIYQKALKLPWEKIFTSDKSFHISTVVNSPHFNHSQYLTLRLKDAIADRFRNQQLNRPSVARERADVRIQLHIRNQSISVLLDSSGEPLFKRGYRIKQHRAPINECLAAGMILKSGWRGEVDFFDPMCGSATIPIEAAMIAMNIPPNLNRTHFAFEEWDSYDASLFSVVLGEAKEHFRPLEVGIYASDINSYNLKIAQMNVNEANMRKSIQFNKADFFQSDPPSQKGIILMNPPYGERLQTNDGISQFYAQIGTTLKHKYSGWKAWIISSEIEAFKKVGLKPAKKIPLMNGKLPCQLRAYELFSGKRIDTLKKRGDAKDN